jgi:hypothetical protein
MASFTLAREFKKAVDRSCKAIRVDIHVSANQIFAQHPRLKTVDYITVTDSTGFSQYVTTQPWLPGQTLIKSGKITCRTIIDKCFRAARTVHYKACTYLRTRTEAPPLTYQHLERVLNYVPPVVTTPTRKFGKLVKKHTRGTGKFSTRISVRLKGSPCK